MTGVPVPEKSACGVLGWPDEAVAGVPSRPETLPGGRPWPRVRVLLLGDGEAEASLTSIVRQDYQECRLELLASGDPAALAATLAADDADAVAILSAGDMLAPGALTALAFELATTGCSAVAGLRVLYTQAPTGLDAPSLTGPAHEAGAGFGAEILWDRATLASLLDPTTGVGDLARAWAELPRSAKRRIGRPVLLRREDAQAPSSGLAIVSLTGTGTVGGAGVAHRRLSQALALAGHRVTEAILSDRPAAAEWTDSFPRVEAQIDAIRPDLVLVGNLHGATRSLDVVGRLAAARPVALVLHDLFALTGRCCHPRECTMAESGCDAACPSADEYPQLAPARIAGIHARKRSVLGDTNGLLLLANSGWTLERSRTLAPAGARSRPVGLAFPTGVFRTADRAALRRRLGLPEDQVLILVSSVIVDGPDKGFADLREALQAVAGPGVGVVAIGRLDNPAILGIENLVAPGLIGDEEDLAAWYGACDLHVTASRYETLGQTPIEAGLCGVPTLAYRTTGLMTSVIDGVTGRLVPIRSGALAEALTALVADADERARLGAFARIAFENRYSPAAAALAFDDILRESGLVADGGDRLAFAPEMLGHFPFAAERLRGARGTVQAPSSPLVRRLRRTKQAILGRRMPLLVRRCLYLASTLRRRAG